MVQALRGLMPVMHAAPAPFCGSWGLELSLTATPSRARPAVSPEWGGMGFGRHVSMDVYTSAALGDKGPTSVDTAGTKKMFPNLPYGHHILLASPRDKGLRLHGQGHGFKAVAHVRCSFLLLSSFSSYIPAHFWSPRAGDTRGGPPVVRREPTVCVMGRGLGPRAGWAVGLSVAITGS